MRINFVLAAALALAACASTSGGQGIYGAELAKLRSDCEARDGILTPVGRSTGQAATDYVCEIRGGGTLTR